MLKYKVIRECSGSDFENAIKSAILYGWTPSGSPAVNSETNQWIIIMCQESN